MSSFAEIVLCIRVEALRLPGASSRMDLGIEHGARVKRQEADVIQIQSSGETAQTVARLEHAISERHLRVVAVVSHGNAARKVGLELRPTTLVIFGNPPLGTRIMKMNQLAGLSLPIQMLVWQGARNRTWVSYTALVAFARRYELLADAPPIWAMGSALGAIAAEAAGH